jgi:hypothetical protein
MLPAAAIALLLAAGANDKSARAEALFQKARQLLKADQAAEACPLLEKSHALDPALGTLMNLADCEERTRKLVSAWLHFNEAVTWAERTHEAARANAARERAAALKPRLSWLSLSTAAVVRGLQVKVNGFSVDLSATPQSVPVDTGEATVVATAETFKPYTRKVRVPARGTVALQLPALEPLDKEALKKPEPTTPDVPVAGRDEERLPPPSIVAPRESVLTAEARRDERALKTGALTMMAGGGAVMVAGIAGLAWSFSTYAKVMRQQPGGPDAAMPTVTRSTFATLQWMYPAAWVAAALGAVAVAGGATWMLLPTGNGAAVSGSF